MQDYNNQDFKWFLKKSQNRNYCVVMEQLRLFKSQNPCPEEWLAMHYFPVSLCGASTGLDSGEPFCLR